MTEQLEKRGFSRNLISRIEGFWPDKGKLRKEIKEVLKKITNPEEADVYRILTANRGKKKSHASANADSEKVKKRGKGVARTRPGR